MSIPPLAFMLLPLLPAMAAASRTKLPKPRVGVVDHNLLPRDDWVSQWAASWESEAIAEAFRRNGVDADILGAAMLGDSGALRTYDALMIPTDHGYPDAGSRTGHVSCAIRDFVNAGGTYIMPMGASHSRWRDIESGEVSEDMGAREDFLGLHWRVTGSHQTQSAAMRLTKAGERAGLTESDIPSGVAAYARSFRESGLAYLVDDAEHPCLSATAVGEGVAIHYCGGLPLDAQVRDRLVACYSAILKAGIDRHQVRIATWNTIEQTRVYSTVPVARRSTSSEIDLSDTWDLAEASQPTAQLPSDRAVEWTPVRMPNSIQNALFEAGKIVNPWVGDNAKQLQWISQRDWYLRKRFTIPASWTGRHVRLRFDGLDYIGSVWLDGRPLGTHEGMLGGPTFEVSLEPEVEHELLVRIHAGSGDCGVVIKPDILCGKSMWGNKYWSLGLWAPVRLVASGPVTIEAPYVRTDFVDEDAAGLWAQAMIFNADEEFSGVISARILDQDGCTVWRDETRQAIPNGGSFWEKDIELEDPELWWPNGLGLQPLYRLVLSVRHGGKVSDTVETRFGVRTIELLRNPTDPDSPRRVRSVTTDDSDKSVAEWDWEAADEAYRWLFVVSGTPIFAKGASWLTSDDLLTLNEDRERWMLASAREAGVNLIRLNGGTSLFETDRFYDLCDEYGLLVWQEVPLNWADENTSPLAAWREQLTQAVLRIRSHPSLALYVGGNEFSPVSPGVGPALGIAREIVDGFDGRPFRMSSPGKGRFDARGGGTYHAYIIPEAWAGDANWYLSRWGKGANFVSEWSIYAYASASCMKRMIPPAELADDRVGIDFDEFARSHPTINVERFAEPHLARPIYQMASWYTDLRTASLAEFAECSQMAHAAKFGYLFENWRADFPYKGGHTVWTWNVPEPAGSWAVIDWFGQPTPAYYWIRRANEPVHVMARTTWFSWGPGDTFVAAVQALSDTHGFSHARMHAKVLDGDMKVVARKSWTVDVPGGHKSGPARQIRWAIPPETSDGYFFLVVSLTDSEGEELSRQLYWMRVLTSLADPDARRAWQSKPVADPLCDAGPWLRPQVASCPTELKVEVMKQHVEGQGALVELEVSNVGKNPAFAAHVAVEPDVYSHRWTDNYAWIEPGERVRWQGVILVNMKGLDPVTNPPVARATDLTLVVGAWNAPEVRLRLGNGRRGT